MKITLSTDGGETFPTRAERVDAQRRDAGRDAAEHGHHGGADQGRGGGERLLRRQPRRLHDRRRDRDAPGVTDDAPAAGATAQYSDALAETVTISAADADTPGADLAATATGLPAGLTVDTDTTSPGASLPGARTFTIDGATTAPPGTYPVEVVVDDGAGHQGSTTFDIVVSPEDAAATYTGDTAVTGAAGAADAPVTLSFSVAEAADLTPGDVAGSTVTFMEGTATLCAQAVVAAGGSATCGVNLATGATHHIVAVIGGRHQGGGAGDVQVTATQGPPGPGTPAPPPAGPGTPPPAGPTAALLKPDLGSVAKRLRLSKSGRVSIRLSCDTSGAGAEPATCAGTLKLTAKIKGKQRTIGRATFSVNRGKAKTVKVRLKASARRALKKATSAKLTVSVTNAGSTARKATKKVTLVPRKR